MAKKIVSQKISEVDILKGQLVRALADYDNLSKRVEKERVIYTDVANLGLVKKLLPVTDMLYQAQKHLNDSGLAIAINEFEAVLGDEGVEKIDPKIGDKFNEILHEAVEVVAGVEDGTIAEVILIGWKYKEGIVIRHAKVKVYKKEVN